MVGLSRPLPNVWLPYALAGRVGDDTFAGGGKTAERVLTGESWVADLARLTLDLDARRRAGELPSREPTDALTRMGAAGLANVNDFLWLTDLAGEEVDPEGDAGGRGITWLRGDGVRGLAMVSGWMRSVLIDSRPFDLNAGSGVSADCRRPCMTAFRTSSYVGSCVVGAYVEAGREDDPPAAPPQAVLSR